MKKVIRLRFLTLLFSLLIFQTGAIAASDGDPVADSSQIEIRNFEESSLNKYRQQADYVYEREKSKPSNWWDEFWKWLNELMFPDMDPGDTGTTFRSLGNLLSGLIVIAIIGGVVWLLVKTDIGGFLTGRGKRVQVDYDVIEENIHEIAYETELQKAEREKAFRRAIRLRYLETLKVLTDKGFIQWAPTKTNHEYSMELSGTQFISQFRKLTLIFDYVWYGEFEITEEKYRQFALEFSQYVELIQRQQARLTPNSVA